MPSTTSLSVPDLVKLVGTPVCPTILDVRTEDDHAADPRGIPGSIRLGHDEVGAWASGPARGLVVVACQRGRKLGQGAAALLRARGIEARFLAGGFEAWRDAGAPLVRAEAGPPRDPEGALWVTRERPKIDRVACPWLIRRFVDPQARFLFVEPSEVLAVAERFRATPFDVEGVFWSHRGEACTFDTMVEEFGLASPTLSRLARIVRGADTARLDLAPEAAGLLAASLGLSRLFDDDLAQLDAGMTLYDALYVWARDAADETHTWPAPASRAKVPA